MLPIKLKDNNLIVAMVDPNDQEAIKAACTQAIYNVQPCICSEKALEMRFEELFGIKRGYYLKSGFEDSWQRQS